MLEDAHSWADKVEARLLATSDQPDTFCFLFLSDERKAKPLATEGEKWFFLCRGVDRDAGWCSCSALLLVWL